MIAKSSLLVAREASRRDRDRLPMEGEGGGERKTRN